MSVINERFAWNTTAEADGTIISWAAHSPDRSTEWWWGSLWALAGIMGWKADTAEAWQSDLDRAEDAWRALGEAEGWSEPQLWSSEDGVHIEVQAPTRWAEWSDDNRRAYWRWTWHWMEVKLWNMAESA